MRGFTTEWLDSKGGGSGSNALPNRPAGPIPMPLAGVPPPTSIKTALDVSPSTDEQKLNKTEAAYLAHLRLQHYAYVGIQNITLKLADDCRLTPDFNYLFEGRMRFVDVKGFQREDALIKMKVAARLFPWAEFHIVKKKGFAWETKLVRP